MGQNRRWALEQSFSYNPWRLTGFGASHAAINAADLLVRDHILYHGESGQVEFVAIIGDADANSGTLSNSATDAWSLRRVLVVSS